MCGEASAPAAGSPGSSGEISNGQKQREGKLRRERVTGEDV